MRCSSAFTIPEMLAVVAIIIIILALILPSFQAAREEGRSVVCMANLSQIGRGTMGFSVEHKGRLPGIWGSVWVGPQDWQGCWLSNRETEPSYYAAAPHTGVIWPYMNKDPEVYRCPTLPDSPIGSGRGSNGKFDYSAWHAFAGARRYRVNGTSHIIPYGRRVPTPWLSEESPIYHLNTAHIEGGFGGSDKIGSWHNGNGNFVAMDGSAHRLQNTTDLSTWSFQTQTPSGATVHLGSHSSGWGGWDGR